jgi:hypothetical protein
MDRTTIYHYIYGAADMFVIDANAALGFHPLEWRKEPWTDAEADASAAKLAELASAAVVEAPKDRAPAKGKKGGVAATS